MILHQISDTRTNRSIGRFNFLLYISLIAIFITSSSAMRTVRSLVGKTALVTGSTDGIGQHTAGLLAKAGAKVLLHGRSNERLEATRQRILKETPGADLETYCYDFLTLNGSKQLAEAILQQHSKLDLLFNNAGVFQQQLIITEDQLESTFAINVAATFILFCKLLPLVRNSSKGRILNVSSISQADLGRIDLQNLQFAKGGFSDYASYSLSKLCIAALSFELATRIDPVRDALVMSCDPGTVNTKMLLAGWGRCGIEVNTANHQFNLMTAAFEYPEHDQQSNEVKINTAAEEFMSNRRDSQLEQLSGLPVAEVHGQYFVGGRRSRCCSDVYNEGIRKGLWEELQRITGVSLL